MDGVAGELALVLTLGPKPVLGGPYGAIYTVPSLFGGETENRLFPQKNAYALMHSKICINDKGFRLLEVIFVI